MKEKFWFLYMAWNLKSKHLFSKTFLSSLCVCSVHTARFAISNYTHTHTIKCCNDLLKFDPLHACELPICFCTVQRMRIVSGFFFVFIFIIRIFRGSHTLLTHAYRRRRVFGVHNFIVRLVDISHFIWISCGIAVYSGVNWSRVIHITFTIDSTTRW